MHTNAFLVLIGAKIAQVMCMTTPVSTFAAGAHEKRQEKVCLAKGDNTRQHQLGETFEQPNRDVRIEVLSNHDFLVLLHPYYLLF